MKKIMYLLLLCFRVLQILIIVTWALWVIIGKH